MEDVKSKLSTGSESSRAMHMIRLRDHTFDINSFVRSIKVCGVVGGWGTHACGPWGATHQQHGSLCCCSRQCWIQARLHMPSLAAHQTHTNTCVCAQIDAPVVTRAFLTHDMETLKLHCGPELLERFGGIFKHFDEAVRWAAVGCCGGGGYWGVLESGG